MSTTDRRVMDAITNHIDRTGMSPTIREIQMACDLSSTSVAYYHVKKLERMGEIEMATSESGHRSLIRVKGHGLSRISIEGVELVRLMQIGAIASSANPSLTIVKTDHLTRLQEWAERVGA